MSMLVTLFMVHAELSSFEKMVLILLEAGLIPNSSPMLTDPLVVIHPEPEVRPSTLPLASPKLL